MTTTPTYRPIIPESNITPAQNFAHIDYALIHHHYLEHGHNELAQQAITFEQGNWHVERRKLSDLIKGFQGLNGKRVPCLVYKFQHLQGNHEFTLLPRSFDNPIIVETWIEEGSLLKYEQDIADCTENCSIDVEPDFQPILLGGLLHLLLRSKKLSRPEKAIITHICNQTIVEHDEFEASLARDMWASETTRDLLVIFKSHSVNDFKWNTSVSIKGEQ